MREDLEWQLAYLAGLAVGQAERLGDEETVLRVFRLPAVKAIARQNPGRLLAQQMQTRGISLEAEPTKP